MPKSGTQELQGPLYNIPDNTHHFNEILKHVSDLKEMRGPVYTLEREHHFNEIEKHVSGIQQLQGPVYDCIANHHFQEIIKDVDKVGARSHFYAQNSWTIFYPSSFLPGCRCPQNPKICRIT